MQAFSKGHAITKSQKKTSKPPRSQPNANSEGIKANSSTTTTICRFWCNDSSEPSKFMLVRIYEGTNTISKEDQRGIAKKENKTRLAKKEAPPKIEGASIKTMGEHMGQPRSRLASPRQP
ncbi:hypothetical protein GOBAR_DD32131 [Gossypium barbadense]|nr:hypothetical protein GOBAR_DD32131 [Gossypium barbadense]